jgi:hypothetical protein
LIAALSDDAVYVLDATKEPLELIKELPIAEPRYIAFAPDQKRLAVSTYYEVLIFDSGENYGNAPKPLTMTESWGYSEIMFGPDGSLVSVGTNYGAILVWDINKADEPPIIINTIEDFSKYTWLH